MRFLTGLTFALLCLPACAAPDEQPAAAEAGATTQAPQRSRPELRFGDRGELLVDGKPRFVLGGYRSGQTDGFTDALRSAADAGFDLVHDYRFESFDVERLGTKKFIADARAYLRKAGQLGLGVFLGLPRKAVSVADEEALTAIVNALADEPALWLWYVYDEPSPEELPLESAKRVHDLLRRLDPGRPSVILTNTPETLPQYLPHCDLMWSDRYPIAATSPEKSSLRPLAERLGANMKVTRGQNKPMWSVVQAHDNKGSPKLRKRRPNLPRPDDRNHRPNESEIRAAAHIAIAAGSMAVVYYWAPEAWYSMKTDTPGIWASLGKVLGELGALGPVLLSPSAPQPLEVLASDDRVMTWTRVHDGKVYVGVVNTEINAPAEVKFRSPDAAGPFRAVGGTGSLGGQDRDVEVRLGPAGVLVLAADARPEPATGR